MSTLHRYLFAAAAVLLAARPAALWGEVKPPSSNILHTPHNLSVSGGGGQHDVRSAQEGRVCIFCHTPHHGTGVTPLWSRDVPEMTIYIPYTSPTMRAAPNQPRGASRLCLSCHDGTIALGTLAGGHVLDSSLPVMPWDPDPTRNPRLGRDLRDDHPISIAYPFGANPELTGPASWPAGLRLAEGTFVECTSCHDPHNNEYGTFLVVDSRVQKDALCTICHAKAGWQASDVGHRTGGTLDASVAREVAASGCRSCHLPHSAPGVPYLLAAATEEGTCIAACHRAPPYRDVWTDFSAQYAHPVAAYQGIHGANPATKVEDVPVTLDRKHVECVDCHNPHQSGTAGNPLGSPNPAVPPASTAPHVNGALRGVRGVDQSGQVAVAEASYEYEICFKCHAGASAGGFAGLGLPARVFSEADESQRFSFSNPSFHPVTQDRQGTGRSLVADYVTSMQRIYCVDCHHPHGSNERFMLRDSNTDVYPAGSSSYPLCFRCHEQTFLLDPDAAAPSAAATLHRSHVVDQRVPCSVCHDPHGVPVSRGANSTNGAHLINFDKLYAGTAPVYDSGLRTCSVGCHATNPKRY